MTDCERIRAAGRISARAAWGSEANFVRWLSQGEALAALGKLVGRPLEELDRELASGAGRCDLLCGDEDGAAAAVVEAQFGTSDLDHALRLLGYALEHEAQHAVLVAEQHSAQVAGFAATIARACPGAFRLHLVQLLTVAAGTGAPLAYLAKTELPAAAAVDDGQLILKLSRTQRKASVADFAAWAAGQLGACEDGPATVDAELAQLLAKRAAAVAACLPPARHAGRLAQILDAAARHKARRIFIVVTSLRGGGRLLDVLDGCAKAEVIAVRASRRAGLTLRCEPRTALRAERARRRAFWHRAATKIAAASGRQVRRHLVLDKGTRSLVFGLGRSGFVMAVAYRARERGFCVDVRVRQANRALAQNQFEQLRDQRRRLDRVLGRHFALDWKGSGARAGEQVLRLRWRGSTDEPFAQHGAADELAAAVSAARAVLVPLVAALEDLRW